MNISIVTTFLCLLLHVLFMQKVEAIEGHSFETKTLIVSSDLQMSHSPFNNIQRVVESNNLLGIRLYHGLKNHESNFVFSPFGIFIVLESLLDSSRGKTNEEISQMLSVPLDRDSWRSSVFILYDSLLHGNPGAPFDIYFPNSLWIQKGEAPTTLFKVAFKEKGDLHQVDFKNDWESLPKEVNEWMAKATDNQFTDLIHRKDIGRSTKMLICNSFNFNSWWNNFFNTDKTHQGTFTLDSGRVVRAEMMEVQARLRGSWQKELSLVELPYNGAVGSERLAFLLLLPNKHEGIEALEKHISPTNLKKWVKSLITQKILIRMPRFSIKTRLPLKKNLREMGIESAFGNQADFSGINGEKGLKLDEIYHVSSLICNEWGSKLVEGKHEKGQGFRGIMSSSNPREFVVDHPFIFLVYDKLADSILMMGRMTNPLH
ncbi:MAG: serpin B [Chlamydiales bacterium]|jgi:serpin B